MTFIVGLHIFIPTFAAKIHVFGQTSKCFMKKIMEKSRILLGIISSYFLHLEQMGKHLVKQNPNHNCCSWDVLCETGAGP